MNIIKEQIEKLIMLYHHIAIKVYGLAYRKGLVSGRKANVMTLIHFERFAQAVVRHMRLYEKRLLNRND